MKYKISDPRIAKLLKNKKNLNISDTKKVEINSVTTKINIPKNRKNDENKKIRREDNQDFYKKFKDQKKLDQKDNPQRKKN